MLLLIIKGPYFVFAIACYYLISTCSVPDTVLSVLPTLWHLTLTTFLERSACCPYNRSGEWGSQRFASPAIVTGHVCKCWSQEPKLLGSKSSALNSCSFLSNKKKAVLYRMEAKIPHNLISSRCPKQLGHAKSHSCWRPDWVLTVYLELLF